MDNRKLCRLLIDAATVLDLYEGTGQLVQRLLDAERELRGGETLVRYTVRIGEIDSMPMTFPQLSVAIRSLTPADCDTVRLLAPGESMEHFGWAITREAQS
jgi:hypothetical protein